MVGKKSEPNVHPKDYFVKKRLKKWLGREDSNLRMPAPKAGALPLGDAPKVINKEARLI